MDSLQVSGLKHKNILVGLDLPHTRDIQDLKTALFYHETMDMLYSNSYLLYFLIILKSNAKYIMSVYFAAGWYLSHFNKSAASMQ